MRQFEAEARTPLLRQQIEDFATQERNHAAIQRAYNRCLAKDGYPMARMEAMMARRIKFGQTYLAPLLCLAITMATEPITAILSERVLQEMQIAALLFGKGGLLHLVTGDMPRYLTASFHPAQHDNYDLVAYGRHCLQDSRDSGTA